MMFTATASTEQRLLAEIERRRAAESLRLDAQLRGDFALSAADLLRHWLYLAIALSAVEAGRAGQRLAGFRTR